MDRIDRTKVRQAFSNQAGYYDETVVVQRLVISRIVDHLHTEAVACAPRKVLDVGSGTGMLLQKLSARWPESLLVGLDLAPGMGQVARSRCSDPERLFFVAGDAEQLPFSDKTFDIVLSTSTLQWLEVLDKAFGEAFRVLDAGGQFHFALFGAKTLFELQHSYRHAVHGQRCTTVTDRLQRFFSREEVAAALVASGFNRVRVERFYEKEYHADVPALLRSLRRIGAGNASPQSGLGLSGRAVMLQMMEYYCREFGEPGRIPATYEIICGSASKP
jgi:malonyl-CoA O-methyltransferase